MSSLHEYWRVTSYYANSPFKKYVVDDLEKEKRAREEGFKQEDKSRQGLNLRIDGIEEQLEEKINTIKEEEKKSRCETFP